MDYPRLYGVLFFALIFAIGTAAHQRIKKGLSFWKTFFTTLIGYLGLFFMLAKFFYDLVE